MADERDYVEKVERQRRVRPYIRGLIAEVQARGGGDPVDFARRNWPQDRATQDFLTRGAVVPTATTTSGVSTSTVIALPPLLGPLSAAGNILSRALNLSFGNAAAINVPTILPSATGVAFIAQGAPHPIRQSTFATAGPLTPKKLALGTTMTRELFEGSSAEAVISSVLAADLSLGIETVLFDTTAADTTRPAGLKNGISALTADTGTDVTAMFNDLATLGAAVATVGGLNFGYIASPKQAIKIQLRKSTNAFPYPVYASSALADAEVCCLAFDALAVAGDATPRFETSKAATLHMEDTTPLALASAGPPSYAAPIRSLYQTDSIGLRLIADLSWILRSTSGFAWIDSVNW